MDGRLQNEMKIERGIESRLASLPSFVSDWYMNLRASKKTAATCRDYIYKITRFLQFINQNPAYVTTADITSGVVTRYFLSVQTTHGENGDAYTSDSYQQTVWCCLNNFLEFLFRNGKIERNYIHDITKPKNRDLDRINEHRVRLTTKDFKKILAATKKEDRQFNRKRDRAILLVFMSTGMRKTALSTITTEDFNLENRELSIVDKGGKRHSYVLSDETCGAITEWLTERRVAGKAKSNHLFISNRGTALGGSSLEDIVGKYTKIALGKRLSPHKLRSGYCSILYEKSGDIEFVRRAVGHANAATTQRYIVTSGAEKARAAEIMSSILK